MDMKNIIVLLENAWVFKSMNRQIKRIALLIGMSLLLFTGCTFDHDQKEIDSLKNDIDELNVKINSLEDDLYGCQNSREEYKEYYDKNCEVDEFIPNFD